MSESEPKRRWYRLTPDRLILGLFAVQVLLLLSERFQWFAFNEEKGWTVLIAVAAVAFALVVMLLWPVASFLSRLRFQFSLRSLVVLVVTIAMPCCWLAVKIREAERQRQTVKAIRKVGGAVTYDYEIDKTGKRRTRKKGPSSPAWLQKVFGEDFYSDVFGVDLTFCASADDAFLPHVRQLTGLKWLGLGGTEITDTGVEHLAGLTNLRNLSLNDTQVTDVGFGNLKGLTKLECLHVSGTQITDVGLEHLSGHTELKLLDLYGNRITDVGLEHLKGLVKLRHLRLSHTQVTDEGAKELRIALPKCWIQRWHSINYPYVLPSIELKGKSP